MLPWDELVEEARWFARMHLARYLSIEEAPTDILGVATGLSIRIVSVPFWEDPDFTGIAVWDSDTFRLIVVNSLLSKPRWAFTVGHELGHLVLGHQPPRHRQVERLANAYAAELLMPADRLIGQIRQYGNDLRLLAGLNGVSLTAMRLRLQEMALSLATS